MLRLIIADDEKIIREAIGKLINWGDYGIELIATCKDGIETFDMICDEYPNIVLTDIKMPGLSGLELIKKAHEIDPDIEFIILSGYGEFEFAKQAMEFGVKHYLLKPINENKIIDAIQKAKIDITKKQALKKLQCEKELLSNQFQTIIKKQFIIETLACKTDSENTIQRYSDLFEFQYNAFSLYYISYLEEYNLTEFVDRLTNLCETYRYCICFNVLYVKNTAIFIINTNDGVDFTLFNSTILSWKFAKMSVNFSCEQLKLNNIKDLFRKLIPNIKRYQKVFLVEDNKTLKEIYNYTAVLEKADEISKDIFIDSELLAQRIADCFSTVEDTEFAKTLASKLAVQVITNMNSLQPHDLSQYFKNVNDCNNVDNISDITINELSLIISETDRDSVQYKNYIEQTLQYVSQHFSDPNLSLKWISENYIFMNVNYLSKQFYKETGGKFSAYLNRIRMEKAKELLVNYSTSKVCMIAKQVGFGENSQYFSQAFKKYTGQTPKEYSETSQNAHAE
jgi:two-component system, response regulator YesN